MNWSTLERHSDREPQCHAAGTNRSGVRDLWQGKYESFLKLRPIFASADDFSQSRFAFKRRTRVPDLA